MSKEVKTSELEGSALDWAVAKCEGCSEKRLNNAPMWLHIRQQGAFRFSTDWAQGGLIIEREGMTLSCRLIKPYAMMNVGHLVTEYGDTPLIAAMRCYVSSKLGDTVEIPEELIKC